MRANRKSEIVNPKWIGVIVAQPQDRWRTAGGQQANKKPSIAQHDDKHDCRHRKYGPKAAKIKPGQNNTSADSRCSAR